MTHISRLVIALTCIALSGCQVHDPYTGENKTSKATSYGLGAAIVCGLIGAGKSGKHTRNAAASCGAIGASIGTYMDHQENELRQKLVNSGVQVKREGHNIRLIMPNNITFDTDRSEIRASFAQVLSSIVMVLNQYPDTKLNIVGHTDSTGTETHNMALSNNRAKSVCKYLFDRNVEPSRANAVGAGERYPIASNQTEVGRALNRRVELSIAPMNISG